LRHRTKNEESEKFIERRWVDVDPINLLSALSTFRQHPDPTTTPNLDSQSLISFSILSISKLLKNKIFLIEKIKGFP
jgi:hypothetical protein